MYGIKVNYTTGDSFHDENIEDEEIGLVWEKEELAIKALDAIEEQYKLYKELDNVDSRWVETRTRDEIMEEANSKYWAIEAKQECNSYWQWSVAVEMDDGSFRNLSTSWCGYFETLHSAEIYRICDTHRREF